MFDGYINNVKMYLHGTFPHDPWLFQATNLDAAFLTRQATEGSSWSRAIHSMSSDC